MEIERIIRLMMKVSLKKTTVRKKGSSSQEKTKLDYDSMASGTMQHKVWRFGEQKQTTTTTNINNNNQRQITIRSLGSRRTTIKDT